MSLSENISIEHFQPSHTDSITLEDDYKICRNIMQAASKNYTFSSLFLPRDKRAHVEALYAVVRVGDDLVDVDHQGYGSPQAAIVSWQAKYWNAFERGDSADPVLRAYLHTAHKFNIPPEILSTYFRAMIDDLHVTRYQTFEDLLYYIGGSAIPIGRAMCHILGANHSDIEEAYPAADKLSIAMQLSNFWRDMQEDWERGRIYIPQEDMERFEYSEDDLANGRITPNLISMLDFEFERTRSYYEEAREGISSLKTGRWGVMNSLEIYSAIMDDIEAHNYDVFSQRAGTTVLQKLGLVACAWWQTKQTTYP